jgi:hypothetical protein
MLPLRVLLLRVLLQKKVYGKHYNFGKAEENPRKTTRRREVVPKRTSPTRKEDPVRTLIKSVKAKINPSNH